MVGNQWEAVPSTLVSDSSAYGDWGDTGPDDAFDPASSAAAIDSVGKAIAEPVAMSVSLDAGYFPGGGRNDGHSGGGAYNSLRSPACNIDLTGLKVDGLSGPVRDQILQRINKVGLVDPQCVTLAMAAVGVGKGNGTRGSHVNHWVPAERVTDGNVLPGTPISTFLRARGVESSIYAAGTGGREGAYLDHAAVFLGYVRDRNAKIVGINVLEQYRGSGGAHQHTYLMNSSGGEHDASMYRIIKDNSGQYLGGDNNPMTAARSTPAAEQKVASVPGGKPTSLADLKAGKGVGSPSANSTGEKPPPVVTASAAQVVRSGSAPGASI